MQKISHEVHIWDVIMMNKLGEFLYLGKLLF